jgi:uncharacterized protein
MLASDIITQLELIAHPEGGWYREVYRSSEAIPAAGLPDRFSGTRACATHIYYLLEAEYLSHYHRIQSDELWHFYAGEALDVHMITEQGALEILHLNPANPFAWVPAGTWFSACVPSGAFALCGCSVAPGFDFADFELADRQALLKEYPDLHDEILRFT